MMDKYDNAKKRVLTFGVVFVIFGILLMTIQIIHFEGFTGFIVNEDVQEGDFGGTYSNTFYNDSLRLIQLDNSGGYFGSYESGVIDVVDMSYWNNISWYSDIGDEYEYGYGYSDLFSDSVLILHFNNDSSKGENGSLVADFSAYGNDVVCEAGGCPSLSDGRFDSAYYFNGTSGFFFRGDSSSLDFDDELTISFWFNASSNSITQHIIGKGYSEDDNFDIFLVNDEVYVEWNNTATQRSALTSGANFVADVWNHAAISMDGSDVMFYVNGVNTNNESMPEGLRSNGYNLTIGRQNFPGSEFFYEGMLDEIVLLNKSLGYNDVKNLYNRGAARLNVSVRVCDDSNCDGEDYVYLGDSNPSGLDFRLGRYFQYMFGISTENISYSPLFGNVSVDYTVYNETSVNASVDSPNETLSVYSLELLLSVNSSGIGAIWYSLDGFMNITVCDLCENASLEIPISYYGNHTVIVYVNDSLGNLNVTEIDFNAILDTDQDGLADDVDPDDDNDGILDGSDSLSGNLTNVAGNFDNLSIIINGSDNLTQGFSGLQSVMFYDNGNIMVSFDFNFSEGVFLLSNVSTIYQEDDGERGYLLVRGITLPEGYTKTLYVNRINRNDQVCLRDAQIMYVSQVSDECDGVGEILLDCPLNGMSVGGYTCTLVGDYYRVEGAAHTAVLEVLSIISTGGAGGGGPEAVVGYANLSLVEFPEIRLRRGGTQEVTLGILNSGERFLNRCGISVKGDVDDWVHQTGQIESMSSGQRAYFVFNVSVPIDSSSGDYESYLHIVCDELEARLLFDIEVLESDFDFFVTRFERGEGLKLIVDYDVKEFTGISQELVVSYKLIDLDGVERIRGEASVKVDGFEERSDSFVFELPKDSFGEFLFEYDVSNGVETYSNSKDLFLSSRGVTGLAISDSNLTTITWIGAIVGVLIVGFFVLRFIRKGRKSKGSGGSGRRHFIKVDVKG